MKGYRFNTWRIATLISPCCLSIYQSRRRILIIYRAIAIETRALVDSSGFLGGARVLYRSTLWNIELGAGISQGRVGQAGWAKQLLLCSEFGMATL